MVAAEVVVVVDPLDDSVPRMITWADAVMAAAKATTLTAKVMARIFMMVPLSGNNRICFIGRGFRKWQ